MKQTSKLRYLLYIITNDINNKIYIGQHVTSNIEDSYFGSGKLLKRAINKYGLEHFIFKVLFECQNANELNLLEATVVNEEFVNSKDTYNMHVGGPSGFTDKERQKSLKTRIERYGTKASILNTPEIQKRAQSASLKARLKIWGHPMGAANSIEAHKKIAKHAIETKRKRYGSNTVFMNTASAHLKSAKTQGYAIKQYSTDMKLINCFYSSHDAARQTGFNPTSIRKHCSSGKMYKNYYWKFDEN